MDIPTHPGRRTREMKSVERVRSRSRSRTSGPKSVLAAEAGKERRRRMSDTHRRDSRSKAASRRRERSELRPPLPGHPGIGRASLPARLASPMMVADVDASSAAERSRLGQVDVKADVQPMQQENKEPDSRWTPDMIAEAAGGILGQDEELQLRYTRWLRVVLSLSETPPAAEVVEAGLVPRLFSFLHATGSPELRPEALCALTNIASTPFTRAVATGPDAIPILKALLASPDVYLREQSAWCLGNIAGDCVELRDLVLSAGVMEPLLASLSTGQDGCTSFMRTGTWALNNLLRGVPAPALSTVLPVLPVLRRVIASSDEGTLIDAGWVLYHITRGGSDRIDAVLSAGLLTSMPDLLLHENPQVVRPVLRAMDNLACTSGTHRAALIAAGALDPLVETMSHDSSKVRADALRLLSCIAAGSADQVAAVAATNDIFPSVVTELEEGNALCRREAGWVLLNMCECGLDVHTSLVPDMVAHGAISAVCRNLEIDAEVESLTVMLSLLLSMLDDDDKARQGEYVALVKEADGFDRTMALIHGHDDMDVYDKAMEIVRRFMDLNDYDEHDGTDDDDDDDDEGDHAGGAGGLTSVVMSRSRSGEDADGMSDDGSGSDDSFHPELGDTEGPITPPPRPNDPAAAATAAEISRSPAPMTASPHKTSAALSGARFRSCPRQPLCPLSDPRTRNNQAFDERGDAGDGGTAGGSIWG